MGWTLGFIIGIAVAFALDLIIIVGTYPALGTTGAILVGFVNGLVFPALGGEVGERVWD